MIAPFTFIRPCAPALKRHPPDCQDWIHEIKFAGAVGKSVGALQFRCALRLRRAAAEIM